MEIRKADRKGRIYLGEEFSGKKLYVIRAFGSLFVTEDEERAKEIEERKEEFLKREIEGLLQFLGEPSPEEVKEV
ncbi:hypothetical protein [Sulfuracidifex tepidarius]|uniref:VapB-type antitoxin n=1 Tax=Sulfuracidifex tepidarius TaxID=1294262 RepID=A0A510E0R7_9CREN|nr:hypothetical protein [Sulfuracidifex tepidarius]BBG26079.1 hypothetical protein IC007_0584 [Sulfuracidifex tepidarius]